MKIKIIKDSNIDLYYTGIKFHIFGREIFLFKTKRNYFEMCLFYRKLFRFFGIDFLGGFIDLDGHGVKIEYEMTIIPQHIKESQNGKRN